MLNIWSLPDLAYNKGQIVDATFVAPNKKREMKEILNNLIKVSRVWASGGKVDLSRVKELRSEAILLNHTHYLQNIPLYRKLAGEEGCGQDVDIQTIKEQLMFTADVFKGYQQEWLDSGDFTRMTQWLAGIYHRSINADISGIKTIDEWIERLSANGIHVVYSSGTSGEFSFVPREKSDWELSRIANINYLAPLWAGRMAGSTLSHLSLKSAVKLMPPDLFARMVGEKGVSDFDAAFLGFRHGRMGNQALIEELAPIFRRHYYLYDLTVTGTTLRSLRRGAKTDEEQQQLSRMQEEVSGKEETNYLKLIDNIRKSAREKQKVFIFGAPYQFKKLCEVLVRQKQTLVLTEGSFILFGGGWKSFNGESISREALTQMMTDNLNVPPQLILEGYSMTEINSLMLRCKHGRFHIPPIIEPVILDEELNPLQDKDVKGAFGFLDPLAVSYPGFIISGDYVRMLDGECDCGLIGPAITEIGRMPGSEVKGCGGIMGTLQT